MGIVLGKANRKARSLIPLCSNLLSIQILKLKMIKQFYHSKNPNSTYKTKISHGVTDFLF